MRTSLHQMLYCLLPDHLQDHRPDPNSPHRRRYTRAYRRKRELVKNLWIGAGLITLTNPTLSMALIVGLPMIFLAFTVLDETP